MSEPPRRVHSRDLPPGFFLTLPRGSTRAAYFDEKHPHNSIWDLHVSPDRKIYVSLCGELNDSVGAELHTYDPGRRAFDLCFQVGKVMPYQGMAIPPSKIHTSIDTMEDGRLIMATHTTARGPGHPTWMFDGHFNHLWEGYAGSHLFTYDPATREARCLGCPVPRDSIYGGIYDRKHRAYYFQTWLRGHLYRYNMETGEVRDLGQASEFGSFAFVRGADDHLYSATRSGWLYRINVDRGEIEDLSLRFPRTGSPRENMQRQLHYGTAGPDGRLYLSVIFSRDLFAFDPATNRLESVGSSSPEGWDCLGYPRNVYSPVFDSEGRLWYAQTTGSEGESLGCHLISRDLFRGGAATCHGAIGTAERCATLVSEIRLMDDVLYITDTNHANDRPGLIEVDLKQLRDPSEKGEPVRDARYYCLLEDGAECYPSDDFAAAIGSARQSARTIETFLNVLAANPPHVRAEAIIRVPLWRSVGAERSAVHSLKWLDANRLVGTCGKRGEASAFSFTLEDGRLASVESLDVHPHDEEGRVGLMRGLDEIRFPGYPGRQYRARPSAMVKMTDGSLLVGTHDGYLARWNPKGNRVFALGSLGCCGAVHQMAVTSDGTRVFGVAGHPEELGTVFFFDEELGLRNLGRIYHHGVEDPGSVASCEPCCLAISPDDQTVAIGVRDRLGSIYLYTRILIS
ncbi:MAG TPA: hypothetical protein VNQ90_10610 [Chthoniobacteraceae bacterium]|nr:hypothetical protein [Chthoniobacteraceae bacterium]